MPADLGRTPSGTATTQSALGRALLDVNRAAPEAGARIVTVSPDVSSSTNLAGWVNKAGVWSSAERTDWFADDTDTILHWRERPASRHIELGIAETNLVGALGELGATWSRTGQPLFPVGVLYDPFVARALEPWSFGVRASGPQVSGHSGRPQLPAARSGRGWLSWRSSTRGFRLLSLSALRFPWKRWKPPLGAPCGAVAFVWPSAVPRSRVRQNASGLTRVLANAATNE